MNSLLVACVLLFGIVSSLAVPHSRGCIYIVGRCQSECPEGTHAYALGCGYKTPEATCKEPKPVAEEHMLCDYSACYCDPPTLRDEKTGKCVLEKDCSKDNEPAPVTTLLPPLEDPKPTSDSPAKTPEDTPAPVKPADTHKP